MFKYTNQINLALQYSKSTKHQTDVSQIIAFCL